MLYIMTLVGFGIGAALIITGLIIPPRKARVSIRVITVLVGLWTITELTLWSLGIPTISNRMVRIAARAPVVHLNQELLDYRGTVELRLSPLGSRATRAYNYGYRPFTQMDRFHRGLISM